MSDDPFAVNCYIWLLNNKTVSNKLGIQCMMKYHLLSLAKNFWVPAIENGQVRTCHPMVSQMLPLKKSHIKKKTKLQQTCLFHAEEKASWWNHIIPFSQYVEHSWLNTRVYCLQQLESLCAIALQKISLVLRRPNWSWMKLQLWQHSERSHCGKTLVKRH